MQYPCHWGYSCGEAGQAFLQFTCTGTLQVQARAEIHQPQLVVPAAAAIRQQIVGLLKPHIKVVFFPPQHDKPPGGIAFPQHGGTRLRLFQFRLYRIQDGSRFLKPQVVSQHHRQQNTGHGCFTAEVIRQPFDLFNKKFRLCLGVPGGLKKQ